MYKKLNQIVFDWFSRGMELTYRQRIAFVGDKIILIFVFGLARPIK
jgi:hypothetical protein